MDIASVLQNAKEQLKNQGIVSASIDAEILLAHVLKKDRIHIIAESQQECAPQAIEEYKQLINERASFKPVAYITGTKEFYGLDFKVTPSVLIPRPETEELIDMVLYYTPLFGSLLDIGTGSGAIAITSQYSRNDIDVFASDISLEAIQVAKENEKEILKEECITFYHSDLFDDIPLQKFHCIVSNPPYVNPDEKDSLAKDLSFEPSEALFAEDKGTAVLKRILETADKYLADNGTLLCEIGYDQSQFMKDAGQRNGFSVSILSDLAGHSRIAICTREKEAG